MKTRYTNTLMETVYSYQKAENLFFRRCWDLDESWETKDNNIAIIDGKLAMELAEKAHLKITGKLQEGVGYIFRFTRNGDKLVAYHMTMLPKTSANIEQGSNRYGSGAIRKELC